MNRVHAFSDDALSDYDAVGLAAALARGQVSVPEVVEAAIERSVRLDASLNAIAVEAFDAARAQARSPRGGYFAGVPTYLKDNVDRAGLPTQHGCDAFVASASRRDGDLARMTLATGLLDLGKTRLSEQGFSASNEHPRQGSTRSPWDTARTAGASSAGAAALVAGGAVPIAHGNDGGGSIRIPASVNGLVGLKPTRGRLAQDALHRQMPVRIVSDGVLTRSVRDTAAFLREAERVYRPLHLQPVGDVVHPAAARLRIAFNTTSLHHPASPEVDALTRGAADLLRDLGHEVDEIGPEVVPETFPDDFLLYWSLLALAIVRSGRLTYGRTWQASNLDNLTLGLDRHARRNLHHLPGAIRRLRRTPKQVAADFHQRYDVLLTPTLGHETPLIGHLDPTADFDTLLDRLLAWVSFTPLQNVSGQPSISLPLATTAAGLPQGMMFTAAWGHEAQLLGLALELEQARPPARITD